MIAWYSLLVPLVKYLRQSFLTTTAGTTKNTIHNIYDERAVRYRTTAYDPPTELRLDLGKVLSMQGDFSFTTPLNPSDRYLNRTLGGGVTLDVGCYLVELALLAAYDHRKSYHSLEEESSEALREYLMPEDITATGHGCIMDFHFL